MDYYNSKKRLFSDLQMLIDKNKENHIDQLELYAMTKYGISKKVLMNLLKILENNLIIEIQSDKIIKK